ncbi:helix-turn-helix transcriptional regulator [Azonexus hydrophilus]|uniref:Helix-turn-helix transcriptional regulator n=1 Tax=Azonexus hydrophilus TaxID=418702 RepID=A0ABZ2XNT6_9RHOO
MTGLDFRNLLISSGLTQQEFANEMGVHRTVIGRQYKAKVVDPVWSYALAGYLAMRQARELVSAMATKTR